jgi:predicted site-specific integrase-resolvase
LGIGGLTTIVVEHRYRFARFAAEYIEASLSDQSRTLVVVDAAEIDDDLVRDVTEILTSLGARLYETRAAANRARRRMAEPHRDRRTAHLRSGSEGGRIVRGDATSR